VIYRDNIVIPALGAGMMIEGDGLEYSPEYRVQYLSVCLSQYNHPHLRTIADLDWNQYESDHYNAMS
jgi:hypothetical protein